MAEIGVKLNIHPEIISSLSAGNCGYWRAAHADGSDNRINEEAIMDAATVGTSVGILTAVFQGLKKAFKNRGKTREDLAAEKEAKKINVTCGSLELMLRDYLRAAQSGVINEEDLDDLIETLEEMQRYSQAGKLKLGGMKELAEICQSIADYTAAMTGSQPARTDETPAADAFRVIKEQLILQKKWLEEKGFLAR